MLEITVSDEYYDNKSKRFVVVPVTKVQLEHSLASLSKWEEKYEVPFLSLEDRSDEQTIYYIECMCLTPNVPPELFERIARKHGEEVHDYLERKHTATYFSEPTKPPRSSEVITAELVYYWLDELNINWEVQYWNLNKLFTLIKVHNLKNAKPQPMNTKEAAARRRAENERRLKQYNTTG